MSQEAGAPQLEENPARKARTDKQIAFLLVAVAFALYLRTLAPDVLPGDPGEFQTAAWRWGLAHPTGYPIYRLEWQGMGSLQRRLRNCFIGVRAEPYAYGSPEFVSLELYLMWRARGMPLETPAVRP